jgi:hypothetical protein
MLFAVLCAKLHTFYEKITGAYTSHLIHTVIIIINKIYFTGEIVAQVVIKGQLQHYFRYIIVNTLHKGDNKDNNNNKFLR